LLVPFSFEAQKIPEEGEANNEAGGKDQDGAK